MSVLRWGIISTAKIGTEQVIPATQQAANCEVVAIGSRSEENARAAADRLSIPRAYGSYEEVIEDPDVDAIYIPLPNHLHAEWTLRAARAGKHVLCEKPMAMSADEAQTMVDGCAEAGVKFMEAFMYRLHPTWDRVRELVDEGAIGDLVGVQNWFSYYNDDPDDIRNQPDIGGGGMMDIGCYSINLSRMLFKGEPEAVNSVVRRDPDLGVDILASAVLSFPQGLATFTCSTRSKLDQYVTIHGSEGRIWLEVPFNVAGDRPSRVFVHRGDVLPPYAEPEVHEFPPLSPYTAQAERFAAAVLDDTPVPIPPQDGVENMRVLERVLAAST